MHDYKGDGVLCFLGSVAFCGATFIFFVFSRVRPATNFAFGVIRNNEFHVTPVHATMQMRPCFDHIDEAKVRP